MDCEKGKLSFSPALNYVKGTSIVIFDAFLCFQIEFPCYPFGHDNDLVMFENKEDAKMYFKKHSFEICAGKLTFKLPSDGTDPKVEIHETVLNNKSVEYSEGVGILDNARWAKFAERWMKPMTLVSLRSCQKSKTRKLNWLLPRKPLSKCNNNRFKKTSSCRNQMLLTKQVLQTGSAIW